MKRIISVFALLLTGFTGFANQELEITDSRVKSIVLYPGNAFIERDLSVSLVEGMNQVRITGLSPYIDQNSIQILGTGNIVIYGHSYEINYLSPIGQDDQINDLVEQIKKLEGSIKSKSDRLVILKEQVDLLNQNKRLNENGASVEELKELFEFYGTAMEAISKERFQIDLDLADMNEEKQKLQEQLNQYRQAPKSPSGEVIVNVESSGNQNSKLEFTYLTSQAGWTPGYDIRVKDVSSQVGLTLKANILNNTFENWENVSLALSNGNPNSNGMLPELFPWRLDLVEQFYQPRSKSYSQPSPAVSEMMDLSGSYMEEEVEMKNIEALYVEQQTTIEYQIPDLISIAHSGKSTQLEIKSYKINADYRYYSVPKLDRSAYLVAEISNWEEHGLLNGPANLYFENRFVGRSFVDANQMADTFKISLGKDRGIIIDRKLSDRFEKEKFIGGDKVVSRAFELTVRNKKSQPIDLILIDQVPVSATSEIDVKLLSYSEASWNKTTGQLTWKLNLQPGSNVMKDFAYEVRFPKDERVMLE